MNKLLIHKSSEIEVMKPSGEKLWIRPQLKLHNERTRVERFRIVSSELMTPTRKIKLTENFSLCQSFQLLLILTAVQVIGAIASFTDISELWAVYSVTQGLQVGFCCDINWLTSNHFNPSQGLLIAMLVSCNCRILRLYAQPRGTKKRKENYTSLRDGEGGRFGILSVTNPNYENFSPAQSPLIENEQNLVKMSYREDDFIERNENTLQQPTNDKIFGDLSSAVNIKEIVSGPTPTTV